MPDRLAWLLTPSFQQLHFACRLLAAMSLSLFLTMWLELDRPYWSALEVAVMIQPIPGMAVVRAFARSAGSILGGMVSLAILGAFTQYHELMIAAMAIWVSFCCFMASLLRNNLAYGFAIAGFICGIILMLSNILDMTPFNLTVARVLECLIAAISVGIVNLVFTPPTGLRHYLEQRAALFHGIGREFLRLARLAPDYHPDTSADTANPEDQEDSQEQDPYTTLQALVSQAIALEQTRLYVRYESPAFANANRLARRLDYDFLSFISAISSLHFYLIDRLEITDTRPLVELIEPARRLAENPEDAQALKQAFSQAYQNILQMAQQAIADKPHRSLADWVVLSRTLGLANRGQSIAATQILLTSERQRPSANKPGARSEFSYPLDYREAIRNSIRTFTVITAGGAFWVGHHDQIPASVLMILLSGLTVIFSTLPIPPLMAAKSAAKAVTIASISAFIVNFGFMPQGNSFATLVLMMAPVIFIGGLAMGGSNPARAGLGRVSIIMFSLLTNVKNDALTDFTYYAPMALGLGIAVTMLIICYTLILPASPGQRLREQLTGAFREIARGTRGRGSRARFETRMYDRLNSLAINQIKEPYRFSARKAVHATINIGLEVRSLHVLASRISIDPAFKQEIHQEIEALRKLFSQKQNLAILEPTTEHCLNLHDLARRLLARANAANRIPQQRLIIRAAICAELAAAALGDYLEAFETGQSPLPRPQAEEPSPPAP